VVDNITIKINTMYIMLIALIVLLIDLKLSSLVKDFLIILPDM
jgi:hypothetical protein